MTKPPNGSQVLSELRPLPGIIGVMTATLTCTSNGNWASPKSLVVDPSVKDRYEQRPMPIVEAADP